jgi:hypothetical protein
MLVDEQVENSLRDQADRLRAAITALSRAARRLNGVGGSWGWVGPASTAYDAAIGALRLELLVAEGHLTAALRDTVNATTLGENREW